MGILNTGKERVISGLKVAVALLFGSIPIMLILPLLLGTTKLPMGMLEYISDFMLPVIIGAFILGLINAVRIGRKIGRRKITIEQFLNIAVGFGIAISLMFAAGMFGDLMKSSARIQVKEFLASVSGEELVYIDGQLAKEPHKIVDQLKNIRWMPGHWSHDTDRINIRIIDGDKNMNLFIRRDSDVPREYWVYYPYYKSTSKMEIGRIYTDIFDDFKGK